MADKRNGKTTRKKSNEDVPYVQPTQTEEELDHIITDLEANLNQTPEKLTTKRKRSNSADNKSLDITEFQINEAEEPTSKPTKDPKIQHPNEVAQQPDPQQPPPPKQTVAKTVELAK